MANVRVGRQSKSSKGRSVSPESGNHSADLLGPPLGLVDLCVRVEPVGVLFPRLSGTTDHDGVVVHGCMALRGYPPLNGATVVDHGPQVWHQGLTPGTVMATESPIGSSLTDPEA